MKTNKEWLETLPEPVRGWALSNLDKDRNKSLWYSLDLSFNWKNSKFPNESSKNHSFWKGIYDSIKANNNNTLTIPEMNCILKEFGLEKYCVSEDKNVGNNTIAHKERDNLFVEELIERFGGAVLSTASADKNPIEQAGSEKLESRRVTMSLETAKELYKDLCTRTDIASVNFKNWLLENFTKEELEPVVVKESKKEGFTWEDLFPERHYGFWIDKDSVRGLGVSGGVSDCKAVFKTEKQALSTLAFAQLSHIVAKYNEGKSPVGDDSYSVCYAKKHGVLGVCIGPHGTYHLEFYSHSDTEISLRVNRKLWEQYWMISE